MWPNQAREQRLLGTGELSLLSLLSLTAFLAQQAKSCDVSLIFPTPLAPLTSHIGKTRIFCGNEVSELAWCLQRDITSDPSWSNYQIIPSEVLQRRAVVLSLHQTWQISIILKGSPKSNGCNYFRIDVVFRWWTPPALAWPCQNQQDINYNATARPFLEGFFTGLEKTRESMGRSNFKL